MPEGEPPDWSFWAFVVALIELALDVTSKIS